jgi:hypothetical protein
MKVSNKLAFLVILSALWTITTIFAVANAYIIVDNFLTLFMCACPVIAFILILYIYNSEFKEEQRINELEEYKRRVRINKDL